MSPEQDRRFADLRAELDRLRELRWKAEERRQELQDQVLRLRLQLQLQMRLAQNAAQLRRQLDNHTHKP